MQLREAGFSLVEMLIAMTVGMFVILAALAAYTQVNSMNASVRANIEIQDNVRLGIDLLERDLRMIGFRVPVGQRIGGTDFWAPAIFYASPTAIGFRADLDGGNAEIVCTPKSTSGGCPLNKLRLDSLAYYQRLNCVAPSGGSLQVVAALGGDTWLPLSCSGVNTGDTSISISPSVASNTFSAGESEVLTLEQVYFRFVSGGAPSYGRLERTVVYANTPSNTFPPTSATWTTVADRLTSFSIEYRDAAGTLLSGNPLSAANRGIVARIMMNLEGYDPVGPRSKPQLYQARSEVLVRNPS